MDIRVVDSRTVGPTHTAAVELVVALRDEGRDADAVVAALGRLRAKQRLVFALETLEYLHRGGRIGGGEAFVGTVLSIKPILGMTDGKIEAIDRVRTYPRALTRLVDEVATAAREWGPTKVICAHAAEPSRLAPSLTGWRRSPASSPWWSRSGGCSAAMPAPAASGSACTPPRWSRADPLTAPRC